MARPIRSPTMPVKPGVRIAGMVKHTVKNQAHPFALRVVAQTQQRAVAADSGDHCGRPDMQLIQSHTCFPFFSASFIYLSYLKNYHAKERMSTAVTR